MTGTYTFAEVRLQAVRRGEAEIAERLTRYRRLQREERRRRELEARGVRRAAA